MISNFKKNGVVFLIGLIGFLLILSGVYLTYLSITDGDIVIPSKETYLVQFNTNGGSLIESQHVEAGNYILEPATPVKEGFVFLFWKYNDEKFDFNIQVTDNMTLSAVWEVVDVNQEKYTVSFNTNGGNVLGDIVVLANNPIITLPIPKKDGYLFKGWQFKDEQFYNSVLVDKDMTLVAIWEKIGGNGDQSSGNNIIGDGSDPDGDIIDNDSNNNVGSSNKRVRSVDNLKIVVDSTTIKFSDYAINFSQDYDKNYYYSSVDGYEFLKSSTIDGKYEVIGKTKESSFDIKNVNVSKGIYYAVRAYKVNNGKTEYSENLKTVYVPEQLRAPSNVFYKANLDKINVTFDVNDSNVQQYQVLKKTAGDKKIIFTSNIPEASWDDTEYACYTIRGYSEYGNDVTLYGLESREVCFRPILEKIQNINIIAADPATGFDYKTTWNVLYDRPNTYKLDFYRKNANGKEVSFSEEYLFDNSYFSCVLSDGDYAEYHLHGYAKTGDYELIGPASVFTIR